MCLIMWSFWSTSDFDKKGKWKESSCLVNQCFRNWHLPSFTPSTNYTICNSRQIDVRIYAHLINFAFWCSFTWLVGVHHLLHCSLQKHQRKIFMRKWWLDIFESKPESNHTKSQLKFSSVTPQLVSNNQPAQPEKGFWWEKGGTLKGCENHR